jgi:hypothetical protein
MTEAHQLDIEGPSPVRQHRKKTTELAAVPVSRLTSITPMEMLNTAIDRGAEIDVLAKLMDLQERWEANQARKAYIEAKAAFKANAPKVYKDKQNAQYKSSYASIGNMVQTVSESLSKHGLDTSWDFDQTNGIKVSCTLRHVLGHSETVSLLGQADTSGAKNPLQQIKSTLTYLKIATFEGVTGIVTQEGNADDDGNASGAVDDPCISQEQVDTLIELADSLDVNRKAFFGYYKIDSFADIRVSQFEAAKKAIEQKRKV